MSRRTSRRKRDDRAGSHSDGLELCFEQALAALPFPDHARLLGWLRRYRRRPHRIFVELRPSGEWHRL